MAEPFLRWAGGKRWLAPALAPLLQGRLGPSATYYEPFLGGGALFFAVQPTSAVLSDTNADLMAAYRAVAWRHRLVKRELVDCRTARRDYLRMRAWQPQGIIDRGVRLIYLNRNCYAGLYRENRQGAFNVPFGGGERNHLTLCRNGILGKAAAVLRQPGISLRIADFGVIMPLAGPGDVVYCDPTYREVTRIRFDRYGRNVFAWRDQERLAAAAHAAYARGALVVLSNCTSPSLRRLYPAAASIQLFRKKGLGDDRALREECLLVLDPLCDWSSWSAIGKVGKPQAKKKGRR